MLYFFLKSCSNFSVKGHNGCSNLTPNCQNWFSNTYCKKDIFTVPALAKKKGVLKVPSVEF